MKTDEKRRVSVQNGGAGSVYFFGFIGAVIYYIQIAHGFWPVVLAILKACVWPAFLVHDVLRFVH